MYFKKGLHLQSLNEKQSTCYMSKFYRPKKTAKNFLPF